MAGKERRAVLVMPDVGIAEDRLQSLTSEFQNSMVGTLQKAGLRAEEYIVVVVIIIVF